MTDLKRVLLGFLILLALVAGLLGADAMRRHAARPSGEGELPPGSIPVTLNGVRMVYLTPDEMVSLEQVSFVDEEEGKTQEGWLLRDVLREILVDDGLEDDCTLTVSSSSRGKAAELTWAEVRDEANMVMFDLSGRGTVKLVSMLERLDTREEWVQDVDNIEVVCP